MLYRLKGAPDSEPERAGFLDERITLAERRDGVEECRVIREHRAVRYNRWLQLLADPQRVVGPINSEWRLYHGEQHLQLDAGGRSYVLRARRQPDLSIEGRLGELLVQLRDARGVHC